MAYFLICLLLLAHGCVKVPDCDTAQLVSVGSNEKLDMWPTPKWWEEFEDPDLNALIELASQNSPTLKKAEENLKAAFEATQEKKASFFPTVDFLIEDNWEHLSKYGLLRGFIPKVYPAVVNETRFGLSFTYEFDFWGKFRSLFQAALGQAAALAAEAIQAELILTTSIAYTYIELQYLLHKQSLLQNIEEISTCIEQIQTIRGQNSLDSSFVVIQAESSTLDSKAALLEIENQIQIHINKLKALASLTPSATLNITEKPLKSAALGMPKNLCLDLIAQRPDIIAQKARLEAAAQEVNAAKTDFFPNISLNAFLGLDSFFFSKLFVGQSFSGNLSPAFHLPIFTAGRIKARYKEKIAQFNAAVYSYNEAIFQAGQQVMDALSDLAYYVQGVELRKTSLELVQKEKNLTAMRVENALDGQMALLAIQNKVLEMEMTLTELEFSRQLAGINLIKQVGGSYCEQ